MNIVVSELTLEDRKGWEALYYAYAEFYQVPMDQEIIDTVWGWVFDQDNLFYALIAKDDAGHCVGLMHFRAMPSPLRGKLVGFLDDLYVQSDKRGSGVVSALYQALNAAAVDKGWPFVRWITADDNYRGRNVYDKLAKKTSWVTYQMPVE